MSAQPITLESRRSDRSDAAAPGEAHRAAALELAEERSAACDPDAPAPPACDVCGRPAVVHVLDRYLRGQPRLLRFCAACRARTHFGPAGAEAEAPRIRLSSLLALAGLACCLVGVFGDSLVLPSRPGFGLVQGGGLLLGLLIFFVGGLLRADLIALAGVLLAGASLGADLLGVVRGPGFGYRQQLLTAFGLAVLGLGLAARFRSTLLAPWAARAAAAAAASRLAESARADLP